MDDREERSAELPVDVPAPEAAAAPEAAPVPEAASEAASAAEPDYKDRWLRAEAELQNYRRRAQREREESRRATEDAALLEIIAALDDLDRALASAPDGQVPEAWLQGVRLVGQRMTETLSRYGVTALDPKGARFDPAFHEALLEIDAAEGVAPGHVVQVVHKGYARGDRALRPARVVVARHPVSESD
jgi:molecular chaperone GrpE